MKVKEIFQLKVMNSWIDVNSDFFKKKSSLVESRIVYTEQAMQEKDKRIANLEEWANTLFDDRSSRDKTISNLQEEIANLQKKLSS